MKQRLDAVGAVLEEPEAVRILEWIPQLGDMFVEAVTLATAAPPFALGRNSLLMVLRKSELVERFPEAAAQLLIYLSRCVRAYQVADLAAIAGRVPSLPQDLDRNLKEALARTGAL